MRVFVVTFATTVATRFDGSETEELTIRVVFIAEMKLQIAFMESG